MGLAAVDPQAFAKLLQRVCADRRMTADFGAEAAARAACGRLGVQELRLLLLRLPRFAPGHPATASAWAFVQARPEVATSVLHCHAQQAGVANAFVVCDLPPSVPEHFSCQAGWRGASGAVHGAVVTRTTHKAAQQYAAVTLLGHVSGCEPVEQVAVKAAAWLPAARIAGSSGGAARDLSFAARLQAALEQPQVAPAVVAEVMSRIGAGLLIPRDLHAVLFTPDGEAWMPARIAALQVARAEPGTAVAVLTLHQSVRNLPGPEFSDVAGAGSGGFRSTVQCLVGGEVITERSPWLATKRHARGAASLQVLSVLAGLPLGLLPSRSPAPATAAGASGVSTPCGPLESLEGLQDQGKISDLVFKEHPGISGLEPKFVCVAACVSEGQLLSATGRSVGRSGARLQAAQELLAARTRATKEAPPPRTDKTAATGKNPLMLLNDAKMKGKVSALHVGEGQVDKQHGFVAAVTCRSGGRPVRATGAGPTKRAAQTAAAAELLDLIAAPVQAAAEPVAAAPEPAAPVLPQAVRDERLSHGPGGPAAERGEAEAACEALRDALEQGAELTIDVQGESARFLLYRLDRLPLPGPVPRPLRACQAELLLPERGAMVAAQQVPCWQVPVRLLANALAGCRDRGKEAHSVRVWRQVIGLGLELVAAGRVHPAVGDQGTDLWRAGPLTPEHKERARQLRQAMVATGHCGVATGLRRNRLWAPRIVVRAALDAVAEAMLRGPGTPAVLGGGPFTAAVPRQQRSPALLRWADDITELQPDAVAVELKLTVRRPKNNSPHDTELLLGEVSVRVPASAGAPERHWNPVQQRGSDPLVLADIRRCLRRLAPHWPPAERLLERPVPDMISLFGNEAVLLLGDTRRQLEQLGLLVEWDQQWTSALHTRAVVGRRPACPPEAARPTFCLNDLFAGRWQLSVDGEDLTAQQAQDLARAPRPLTRVRDTWVLLDQATAERAADPTIPPMASGEALRAALTGTLTCDGQTFPCQPEDVLAAIVAFLRSGSRTRPVDPPPTLQATLRDYQLQGLAWLANTTDAGFGALLADDMGLGKSVTALALHLHRREHERHPAGPTLIVCPASMLVTWEREIHRFAPSVATVRYHGPGRDLHDATANSIVLTTYETLRRDVDILVEQPFDLVVADEAQAIKNHRTGAARAMRLLNTTARTALTGTPVENNLTEAWAVMDWLNPGLFGPLRAFRDQFARPIEANITDTGLTERLSALLKAFMLRRRKGDPGIATELPAKIIAPRVVSLSSEQADLYQQVADQTLRELRSAEGMHRRGLLLTLFLQLQQICNSPAHFLREPADGHHDPERAAARSGKLAALDDLLPVLTDPQESTLIFTGYRTMARHLVHHLRAHGLKPLYFSGDIAAGRDRQKIIDAFQAAPGRTMVMTVKAGGTGLTLTRASHVVLFDRPWNPAKESQAIDRAHRLGQQRTVTVHQLITENTLEDRVDDLLRHKRALADAVLADGYSALTELSDEQICDLIALGAHR
ncbi:MULTISPECIES: DEAD/DEAH box helicase [Streptacidiphilus]|uniref:DEAD/DEAH box helicase n=1 Tax=Streptacidiphilus cavernicola TaxID=3342716 RepID=A0ABV6UWB7_9ACTN|nr:DEAD/DEAH box helicase [Streptacidiphilus jeojiense]